ncbi:PQQ-like beta-propeller repeat protein [bacterium]|nr:PQQ-like beta-propeller repeat protein [bacterium]
MTRRRLVRLALGLAGGLLLLGAGTLGWHRLQRPSFDQGHVVWEHTVQDYLSKAAIDWEDNIYFGSSIGLTALSPSGTKRWETPKTNSLETISSLSVSPKGLLYAGVTGGLQIYDLDGQHIKTITGDWEYVMTEVVEVEDLLLLSSTNQQLYAINDNGDVLWTFLTGGFVRKPEFDAVSRTIYLPSSDGNLYALEVDGSYRWHARTTGGDIEVLGDGAVIFRGINAELLAYNADGTQRWTFSSGGKVMSSAALGQDGSIYFCDEKYLYALSPDGVEKWRYRTGKSYPAAPIAGPDGTIYIFQFRENVTFNFASQPQGQPRAWAMSILALSPKGKPLWQWETPAGTVRNLMVGPSGTVYLIYTDNSKGYANSVSTIYAVRGP